jgi:hypothetical protein
MAFPSTGSGQAAEWNFDHRCFVFSLCERKDETQKTYSSLLPQANVGKSFTRAFARKNARRLTCQSIQLASLFLLRV